MKAFQFWARFEGAATRHDRSVKITLGSQELPDEDCTKLFSLRGREVYCALIETDFDHPIELTDIEVPERDPEFPKQKSPSERLRNVLFKIWEKDGSRGNFEIWRRGEMEQIIEEQKARLNP